MTLQICQKCQSSFSAYLDGAVSGRQMQQIARHLETCATARTSSPPCVPCSSRSPPSARQRPRRTSASSSPGHLSRAGPKKIKLARHREPEVGQRHPPDAGPGLRRLCRCRHSRWRHWTSPRNGRRAGARNGERRAVGSHDLPPLPLLRRRPAGHRHRSRLRSSSSKPMSTPRVVFTTTTLSPAQTIRPSTVRSSISS